MANSPKDLYSAAQIDTGDPSNYPYGKAKDNSAPGNTDGTPWEKRGLNDLYGFQQWLLSKAGITPTNNPDTVLASQYGDALEKLYKPACAQYEMSGNGSPVLTVSLAEDFADSGYSLASNVVTVPTNGRYLFTLTARMLSNDTSSGTNGEMYLEQFNGSTWPTRLFLESRRFSTDTSDPVLVSGQVLVDVADVATDGQFRVQVNAKIATNVQVVASTSSFLTITRQQVS